LHRAGKLAKRGVALAPNSAKCRLTLACVYFAANLQESALAELERARSNQTGNFESVDFTGEARRLMACRDT
jgi:predicted Zn-dependent protease